MGLRSEKSPRAAPDPARAGGAQGPGDEPAVATAADNERRHVLATLERTRWVIDGPRGAAKLLGLHPNTLRSRMKKLGFKRGHEMP